MTQAISYKVQGLPRVGRAAFLPQPTTDPYSSSYGLVHIAGSPGTRLIPSPRPAGVAGPEWPADKTDNPIDVAPPFIAPQLYQDRSFLTEDSFLLSPQGTSNELLPVPATNIIAVPQPAQTPGPMLGRRVTPWPRALTRWRSAAPIST